LPYQSDELVLDSSMVDSYIVWLCVSASTSWICRYAGFPLDQIGTNLSFLTIAGNKALASIE